MVEDPNVNDALESVDAEESDDLGDGSRKKPGVINHEESY